jgi:AbrB family looped-hinge helix DNA binding protein
MVIRSKVTGKNQVTIPAAIARELNIEPGMELEWKLNKENYIMIRPVMTRAEMVRRIEGKWQPLFPPGTDPIGDLIREREQMDEEID